MKVWLLDLTSLQTPNGNGAARAVIENYLPTQRKRRLCLRQVTNAIFYILRTGCQWRNLPQTYPHWQAVYYYFVKWKQDGRLNQLNQALNQRDRIAQGRQATPSLVCVDSQSVKLAPLLSEQRGIDAAKKVNGRKRQIVVDTGGRLWSVYVHAANQADSQAGVPVLKGIEAWNQRLQKVITDSAYEGLFANVVKQQQLLFEVSSKPFWLKGFIPLRKRWVVERTFAWFNHFRRITKDYEQTTSSAESWLLWANCALMLNRLAK